MTVEQLADNTVRLLADQVWIYFLVCKQTWIAHIAVQVTMMNQKKSQRDFAQLMPEDMDLTMFTI